MTVPGQVEFRQPAPEDAASIHKLVRESGALDVNSLYHYLLLCTHFADTMVVAEDAVGCAGFVSAFQPPRQADTVFVWQIGVDRRARGAGIGRRLLRELVERPACASADFLETTITPGNRASDALFRAFASDFSARVEVARDHYPRHLFGASGHEPENLYRIGPLVRPAAAHGKETHGRSTHP